MLLLPLRVIHLLLAAGRLDKIDPNEYDDRQTDKSASNNEYYKKNSKLKT